MDEQNFSFKDLEQVSLKAQFPIQIGDRKVEPGETIAFFDKIQISNWQEIKSRTASRGGFDNSARVWWESTKEVQVTFSQGIFSKEQFALLNNARLLNQEGNPSLILSEREYCESDEHGVITLRRIPTDGIFVYNRETGEKIEVLERQDNLLQISGVYLDVIVDYNYNYLNKTTQIKIGQSLTNGWLTLQGKTKVQDDVTGLIKTGVIIIPKLKLMSGLSMQLGERATPMVGKLQAIANPTGVRGDTSVMEFIFLDEDIDSDI